MNFEVNALMKKIAGMKKKPVRLTGYIGSADDDVVHLYPHLDPTRQLIIPRECVFDLVQADNDPQGPVALFLDADCEIECVVRERFRAGDLGDSVTRQPCGCEKPPPDVVYARKDELRQSIISLARTLVALGVDEFDCRRWVLSGGTGGAGCCQAWNRLLNAVKSGGNTFDTANGVLASCFGIG